MKNSGRVLKITSRTSRNGKCRICHANHLSIHSLRDARTRSRENEHSTPQDLSTPKRTRTCLLADRAGAALAGLGLLGLGLGHALGQDVGVLSLLGGEAKSVQATWWTRGTRGVTYSLIADLLRLAALEGDPVALVLQALGSDQALDLGGLGVRLLALTLGLHLTANDVLADLDFAVSV